MLFFLLWPGACLFCRVRVPTHLFKENVCLDPDPTESVGSAPLSQKKTLTPIVVGVSHAMCFSILLKKFTFIMYSYVFVSVYSLNNKRIKIKSEIETYRQID